MIAGNAMRSNFRARCDRVAAGNNRDLALAEMPTRLSVRSPKRFASPGFDVKLFA
jgi:hypothetical protein